MVKLFKQGGEGSLSHGLFGLRAKSLTGRAMCQPVVDDLRHLERLPFKDRSMKILVLVLILVSPHLPCYFLSKGGRQGSAEDKGQQGQG